MELSPGLVLPVVVKSHQRCDTFGAKTYSLLQRAGVRERSVHVVVSTTADMKLYSSTYPQIQVHLASRGLANVDKAIQAMFPEGQHYIQIVDDMRNLEKLHGRKLVETHDLKTPLNELFTEMQKTGASHGGFALVRNPSWMKHVVQTSLVLIMESFCIIKNVPGLLPKSHSKIDYERTLLHFDAGGGLVRINDYVPVVDYYTGEGGMSGRDHRTELAAARSVAARFPKYVSKVVVKSQGKTTLRFRRMTAPVRTQTKAATAAATAARLGDARKRPWCPKCSARGKDVIKKAAGQWMCKICPYKFRTSEYAGRRREVKRQRIGRRNHF